MSVKRFGIVSLFVTCLLGGGCFSGEATNPSQLARGLERTVFAYHYAMAFRDLIRADAPLGLLPDQLHGDLPLLPDEWYVDPVTTTSPVTTVTQGITTTSQLACTEEHCSRRIERTHPRGGFLLDETITVWYARGDTTTAEDDQVLGFEAVQRFQDRMIMSQSVTEPADGAAWVVKSMLQFGESDIRQGLARQSRYASLTSDAEPHDIAIQFETKESVSAARWSRLGSGGDADWTYSNTVTYITNRNLKSARRDASLTGGILYLDDVLTYSDGVSVPLVVIEGPLDAWRQTGQTYAGGDVRADRTEQGWSRLVTFPEGMRFATLRDEGTFLGDERRGTFDRSIDGANSVGTRVRLNVTGTYSLRAPGVWEVSAQSVEAESLRFAFTYQSLAAEDFIQGNWSTVGGESASFDISVWPDWTRRVSYRFNDAQTAFQPDEFGTIRFAPDTRGLANVSVIRDEADTADGTFQEHFDLSIGIVAEGVHP